MGNDDDRERWRIFGGPTDPAPELTAFVCVLLQPPRIPARPLDGLPKARMERSAALPAEYVTSLTRVRHPPDDVLVTGAELQRRVKRRSRRPELGKFADDPYTSATVVSRSLPMLKHSPSDFGEFPTSTVPAIASLMYVKHRVCPPPS